MLEARGLAKLGILSGEDLDLSAWWKILSEKLAVSGIVDFVADMATNVKKKMRPNNFGMIFSLLYFF